MYVFRESTQLLSRVLLQTGSACGGRHGGRHANMVGRVARTQVYNSHCQAAAPATPKVPEIGGLHLRRTLSPSAASKNPAEVSTIVRDIASASCRIVSSLTVVAGTMSGVSNVTCSYPSEQGTIIAVLSPLRPRQWLPPFAGRRQFTKGARC